MGKLNIIQDKKAPAAATIKNKTVSKRSVKNKQTTNPWLNAKDTWRDRYAQMANSHIWLMVLTTFAVLIALGCTASAISTANRSHYIPYVIAVDNHGVAVSSGFAQQMTKQNDKVIAATLSQFVTATRSVTVDVAYLRNNITWAYAHLKHETQAYNYIDSWFSGATGVKNPVERAAEEIVNVRVISILKQTEKTYALEWIETSTSPTGQQNKPDMIMTGYFTIDFDLAPNANDVTGVINNPLGLYIKSMSWSRKES